MLVYSCWYSWSFISTFVLVCQCFYLLCLFWVLVFFGCISSVFISLLILFCGCLRVSLCISSCSGCVFCCIYIVFLGNISSAVFVFVGALWFTGMGVSSVYGRFVCGKVGLVLNSESWHIRNYLPNRYRSLGKCFCSLIPWYTLVLVVKYLLLCLIPG